MEGDPISFYAVNIGKINSTSGKLIAGDPVVMQDALPYVHSFPVGKFPVQLAIAKVENDERVAFSRILFSDSPVVKWEFALHDGDTAKPIYGKSFYSFGVDAGTALFIDNNANVALNNSDKSGLEVYYGILKEMDKHQHITWAYGIYEFDWHNLVAFSTGYGDGHYAAYVGYDSKGNICRLLADFALVDWWTKKPE